MFSVAPNILLAPNMTQNAERKHRTQNTNTAHFRSCQLEVKVNPGAETNSMPLNHFRKLSPQLCENYVLKSTGQKL